MKRLLVVAACVREAKPFREAGLSVVVSGVGRVNAALATTLALETGDFDAVLSVGFAGALPGSELQPGAVVIATHAVYAEEGILTPDGFEDLSSMGFELAPFFEGNAVACNVLFPKRLEEATYGRIATVATCSGTDSTANVLAQRTGALAEAMEGAAVIHAARMLGATAGELRVISNQTGNRSEQGWNLDKADQGLGRVAKYLSVI